MDVSKKTKVYSKINAIIVLGVLLSSYCFPLAMNFNLAEVIYIITMIVMVFYQPKLKIYFPNHLIAFCLYAVISSVLITLVSGAVFSEMIFRMLRDAMYYVLIFCFVSTFADKECLTKYMTKLCIILTCVILVQQVCWIIIGDYPTFLIPGLNVSPIVTTDEVKADMLVWAGRNGYIKANGFLSEGAHCAQALSIGGLMLLDFGQQKIDDKTLVKVAFLLLGGVLTFTLSGMVFIMYVAGVIVLNFRRFSTKARHIIILLAALIGILAIILFISNTSTILSVLTRLFSSTSIESADGSSFIRLYKGFVFWNGLPIENKVFGIGFGNYESLYHLYSGNAIANIEREYMSSMSYILVSSGIIGFLLFIGAMFYFFKKVDINGKYMIGLLALMMISASVYSSISWMLIMGYLILNIRNNQTYKLKNTH